MWRTRWASARFTPTTARCAITETWLKFQSYSSALRTPSTGEFSSPTQLPLSLSPSALALYWIHLGCSDMRPRLVDESRAKQLEAELGSRCRYYETCATYGLNVEIVFQDGEYGSVFMFETNDKTRNFCPHNFCIFICHKWTTYQTEKYLWLQLCNQSKILENSKIRWKQVSCSSVVGSYIFIDYTLVTLVTCLVHYDLFTLTSCDHYDTSVPSFLRVSSWYPVTAARLHNYLHNLVYSLGLSVPWISFPLSKLPQDLSCVISFVAACQRAVLERTRLAHMALSRSNGGTLHRTHSTNSGSSYANPRMLLQQPAPSSNRMSHKLERSDTPPDSQPGSLVSDVACVSSLLSPSLSPSLPPSLSFSS